MARWALARRIAAPGALALACLVGCGDGSESPDDLQGVVHGVVRDASSHKAVAGAKVRFVSDTLDEASDKTDKDGSYSISAVTDTLHGHLEVTKSGYAKRVVSVYLDGDVALDVDLVRE